MANRHWQNYSCSVKQGYEGLVGIRRAPRGRVTRKSAASVCFLEFWKEKRREGEQNHVRRNGDRTGNKIYTISGLEMFIDWNRSQSARKQKQPRYS